MKILITGAAGFIGMHTAIKLLNEGHEIVGIDNLNSYYDPKLKEYRLKQLNPYEKFRFLKLDISDRASIEELFIKENFENVIHLAAQAGVRYSIEAPFEYIDSNIVGFMAILEGCRRSKVKHLIYASSSSVYGMNTKIPFSEDDNVDHPVSLYAATKKSNELMAHTYSHLYKIPTTGLRFFTVYGPAGRPDMAPWLFTEAILNKKPIKVFNNGSMERDFTYIDDIVDAISKILPKAPSENEGAPYSLFNIGNNKPETLIKFIETIENNCKLKAQKEFLPMQPGDVFKTFADIKKLKDHINYRPKISLEEGLKAFIEWYKNYMEDKK